MESKVAGPNYFKENWGYPQKNIDIYNKSKEDLGAESYNFWNFLYNTTDDDVKTWNTGIVIEVLAPPSINPITFEDFCSKYNYCNKDNTTENIVDYYDDGEGTFKFCLRAKGFYKEGTTIKNKEKDKIKLPSKLSLIDGLKELQQKVEFLKELAEKAGEAILDLFKGNGLFDAIQILLNKIQLVQDGIPGGGTEILYGVGELTGKTNDNKKEEEEDVGKTEQAKKADKMYDIDYTTLDQYVKVTENSKSSDNDSKKDNQTKKDDETKQSWQKEIKIKNKDEGFTKTTGIPVVPVELYGMSIGSIDLLSVDFIDSKSIGLNKSNIWNILQYIFSIVIKMLFYITIASLLIMLIFFGILAAKNSVTNPALKVKYIQEIKKFLKALGMAITPILIISLSIYGSKAILGVVKDDNNQFTKELPIRVNVDGVYSFSTNVTGFARFMSQSKESSEATAFKILYDILVLVNFLVVAMMFVRMLKMWLYGMLGPLTAMVYAFNIGDFKKLEYKTWVIMYIKLSLAQVWLAIAYRIMLEIGIIG